jgi:xanthine dehydrogenase iron-sulfur cluster and FAD-binding subunit A
MKQIKQILIDLIDICNKLNITVRYEKTSARGGLCKVNDKYFIIIDKKANDEYKATVIANAIKKFDLEKLHIKPKLRDFIDNA